MAMPFILFLALQGSDHKCVGICGWHNDWGARVVATSIYCTSVY